MEKKRRHSSRWPLLVGRTVLGDRAIKDQLPTIGFLSITALLFSACATSQMVAFKVNSEPPGARIDVNGVSMGATPTEIDLTCSRRWVGYIDSSDGWAYDGPTYEVTAYPSSTQRGYSQTKRINPCEWKGKATPQLHFDLGLDRVQPLQRIEVK